MRISFRKDEVFRENSRKKPIFHHLNFFYRIVFLFCCIFASNCGIALTPRLTATIPPEAKTEAFRLNLLYGATPSLYGANLGLMNFVGHLIGAQIGIVNYCPNNTIPVMIIALSAKAKNQLGNTAERGDRIKKTSRINRR
ncbi:LA_2272/LA_2273 family lipoprotein [Leptospira santarosai]|uniref:LA_2272/LA_2273 family lipoprotein n=1 Tax=Leptospira santarosai TaxID=28183 RepID=UPI000347F96A|nr:hypothetical protein [Leptospira santarosai]